jgi:hypothetical protein
MSGVLRLSWRLNEACDTTNACKLFYVDTPLKSMLLPL